MDYRCIMVHTIRLTDAQYSALECAGLLDGETDTLTVEERYLLDALHGRTLRVTAANVEPIADALNELSNSEDAFAETTTDRDSRTHARRAARTLYNLIGVIRRAGF